MPEGEYFPDHCVINQIAKRWKLLGCNEECDPQSGLGCPQVSNNVVFPESGILTKDTVIPKGEPKSQEPITRRKRVIYPSYFEKPDGWV